MSLSTPQDGSIERERFSALMRSLRDAVVMLDANGLVIQGNAAFERLLGWRSGDIVDTHVSEVFRPYDLDGKKRLPAEFDNVLVRGLSWVSDDPIVVKSRLGVDCFVTFRMVPYFGPDSQVIGAYLILENKNERVRLETEMLKTQKLESIGVLAGGIAHDFNNLLTAIVGNLSMVSALSDPEAATASQIKAAETASHRAKNLAQQLLTMCRAENTVRANVVLADLLKESCSLMTSGTHCNVSFELPSEDLAISADENQISQVINNLVLNAVQALDGVGEVFVTAKNSNVGNIRAKALGIEPGAYVEIAVRDNGPGIPKDVLSRIFSPFFTTKDNGNGLGLASCRTIIKRHGGSLDVDSELGLGATFTCLIPAALEESEPTPTSTPTTPQTMSSGKGRILVMDDEEMIRQIAGDMLQILGYEYGSAPDGEEMLKTYKQAMDAGERFDVVIMDLTIPGGMGGKEAAEKLLEMDPDACAVVSSGYSNDPIMEDPKSYGFTAAIQKPYTVQDLSGRMSELVGK
ncbi:MAG: hybrid sensor histidine kinase/response regulator [Opitutales bacterium]